MTPLPARACAALLLTAIVLLPGAGAWAADAPAVPLSAPLPQPVIIAQGVSSANPAHLVRNRAWDFRQMRRGFNTVSLLPGDPSAVSEARAAGLAVVLEFDFKAYFFAGQDIAPKVQAVVQQVRAAPGSIVAIDIADRVNERYGPDDALRYLAATGGVLHRQLPGVPVVVNVADWQLSCDRPNQSACGSSDSRFRYETNAALDRLHDSGYVDGFTIADNLKNNDLQAQRAAWVDARKRWAAPFLLWSTCSQLSFPDAHFPGGTGAADRLTQAYMAQPMAGGADGLALWAWHQEYDGAYWSFLDKDGGSNPLWDAMVSTTAQILAGTPPTAAARPAAAPRTLPAAHIAGGPRDSRLRLGFRSTIGFLLIASVLAAGTLARLRQHARRAVPQLPRPPVPPEHDDVDALRPLRGYGPRSGT